MTSRHQHLKAAHWTMLPWCRPQMPNAAARQGMAQRLTLTDAAPVMELIHPQVGLRCLRGFLLSSTQNVEGRAEWRVSLPYPLYLQGHSRQHRHDCRDLDSLSCMSYDTQAFSAILSCTTGNSGNTESWQGDYMGLVPGLGPALTQRQLDVYLAGFAHALGQRLGAT